MLTWKEKNQWFEEFRHSRNKSKSKLLTLLAGKTNKSNWSQGKAIPSQQNSEPKKKIRSHHHPFELKIKHPVNKVEENQKTAKAFPCWILQAAALSNISIRGGVKQSKGLLVYYIILIIHDMQQLKKQRKISALASHKSKYKHTIVSAYSSKSMYNSNSMIKNYNYGMLE